MKYQFIPNTIDFKRIILLNIPEEELLSIQIIYKHSIEKILKKFFDYKTIDSMVLSKHSIPLIEDEEENFYKKYSSLNSMYLYLRNNIHIENLTEEEIEYIKDNKEQLDENFIYRTTDKVLFEQGDYAILGSTNPNSIVKSKSLIFELSFDSKKCKSLDEITFMEKLKDEIKKRLEEALAPLNKEISVHLYDGIPEVFKKKQKIENFEI